MKSQSKFAGKRPDLKVVSNDGVTPFAECNGYSLSELGERQFAPLKFYVENMIVEGLTILAGRPKKGKSWMVLGMGLDIAVGEDTLGDLTTKQSNVVYYALEDNPRRLHRRVTKLLGEDTADWPNNFHVYHELSRIDDGCLVQVEKDVRKHKAKVVFIDTLQPIRPITQKGVDPYQQDYNAISMLQKLATKLRIALVLVYHTKKGLTDDPQELIMGSTGITGAVDSWFVLKTTADSTELHGGGRDIDNVEWGVKHGLNARWRIEGDAFEMRKSKQRRDVLRLLRKRDAEMKVDDIARALERNVGTARKLLFDMERSGDIVRTRHGHYRAKTN